MSEKEPTTEELLKHFDDDTRCLDHDTYGGLCSRCQAIRRLIIEAPESRTKVSKEFVEKYMCSLLLGTLKNAPPKEREFVRSNIISMLRELGHEVEEP